MPRELKPQKVDEVSSPNGLVTLPIYFDRNEKDFFVEITGPNDRLRADSVSDIKTLAREALAKAVAFKWEAIIAVDMKESYDEKHKKPGSISFTGKSGFGTRIEFEFDRLERSPHPTKPEHFVFRKHTIDFEEGEPDRFDRRQRDDNSNVKTYGHAHDAVVLPYDEETWAGLHALKRVIDDAQAKLEDLVARKDFAARLRLVGKQGASPFLLPAATEGRR